MIDAIATITVLVGRSPLVLALLLLPHVTVAKEAEILSAVKDVDWDNPLVTTEQRDEATAFWSLGLSVGKKSSLAAADQVRALERYISKHGDLGNAALVLAVSGESILRELAISSKADHSRLAAAALYVRALAAEIMKEKKQRSGSPQLRAGNQKKGKKGGGRREKNKGAFGSLKVSSEQLMTLLGSSDEQTLFRSLLAAAYAKDRSVAKSASAVKAQSPQLRAAKLLYAARTGQELTEEAVKAVANAASRAQPKPGSVRTRVELEIPPLALVCQVVGAMKSEALVPILNACSGNSDVRVQMDAMRAMRRVASEACLPALAKTIGSCSWPVLVEACATASAMPDKRMVGVLLKRLANEQGRLRLDLVYALSTIAGSQEATDTKG